ncbi:MAG: Ig-like domain-containing protein [Ferruginibacter sp.]
MKKLFYGLALAALPVLSLPVFVKAQIVTVGSGSYTTTFPGTDAAGRNTYPSGLPITSGTAASKPVPTNDWWSCLIKDQANKRTYNYPLSFRPLASGLGVNYTVPHNSGPNEYREPMSDVNAIVIGVDALNATQPTVSNYSDWTVTANWTSSDKNFNATLGLGMPFMYFTKATGNLAKITVNHNPGGVTISGNKLLIQNNYEGSNYVVYAPAGSTWSGSGGIYTSTLNGKNYWSMAMLPPGADVSATATAYEQYAFVFPGNTAVSWNYAASTGIVRTTFTVTPDVKEGSNTTVLQGLLPHQWARLAAGAPAFTSYIYPTVRGQLKMMASNTFNVDNKFSGIISNMPDIAKYSDSFDPGALATKINSIKNDQLSDWTDSYNEGQVMNRLIQTAHLANQMGNTAARDQMINTVKERLEDWLKAEGGEVAFLFYYQPAWKSLIGYPAGHRQDENLNDHHFHWGYFIHAAAAVEQYQPGWAAQWGGMINLLVRDAASPDRNDTMFPFLRNFSPFAGHCWANGFASEPLGNDQESTSESMQFNSALIHWGSITGNTQIRDLGIYLYTTEQSAIDEYWFDKYDRTFQPEYSHEMMARIWGAGYDNGTWWTSDIAASYGIQLYPIHGGSLYLGHDTAYVRKVWNGMTAKTQVLSNVSNDNLWYDVYWEFLAFIDPQQAINRYNSYPTRNIKFGVSDAHTYHWLHSMNALGYVKKDITANHPTAVVFEKAGVKTYVAQNYGSSAITVTFSDGYTLAVPARKIVTSRDITATAALSANTTQVSIGGSVNLTAATTGSGISKVDFFRDGVLIASDNSAPYTATASGLSGGLRNFVAKVYVGSNLNVSNVVTVQVGNQLPYGGTAAAIPGTIVAGNYDVFEGGNGQDVAYSDNDAVNQGNFRPTEGVDAAGTPGEGNTVGWTGPGEWLEYTVNVATTGNYNVDIRYTSGNTAGGGPFWFENAAGTKISPDISVAFTDNNWSTYQTKTVNGVQLQAGTQVIRVKMGNGGFNLGNMTFSFAGGTPPSASITSPANNSSFAAGSNITINANASDADGTISKVEFFNGSTKLGEDLTSPYSYTWNGVAAGTYALTAKATDNAGLTGNSTVVNITVLTNTAPAVSITSPANGASFTAPASISINANASDADGTVSKVEFYNGATKLGEDLSSPYSYTWSSVAAGTYTLTAVATDNQGATATSSQVSVTVSSGTGSSCGGNGPVAAGETLPDYSWQATNTANPTITFIPGTPISGSNFCILYYKIGSGGYIGEVMTQSGANFTKSITAASGSAVSIYFTYRVGTSGLERNSSATPHSFTVAQCGGTTNTAPTVSVTAPANNASYTAPASITIDAAASDADGTVSKVEFFNGSTKLGEDLTSPYSYAWTNVAAGTYSITAKATDNSNAVTTSAATTVTVTAGSGGTCSGTASNGDYSYNVATSGSNVSWIFIPGTPISGSTLCIIYIKVNSGGYAGYTMNTSGSNFIWTQNIASGSTVTFYFTYRVGNTTTERSSINNPHTYVAGATCGGLWAGGNTIPSVADDDMDASGQLLLYPNPAHSQLFVKGASAGSQYKLYDVHGRVLLNGTFSGRTISLQKLKAGVYVLEMTDAKGVTRQRFIKE